MEDKQIIGMMIAGLFVVIYAMLLSHATPLHRQGAVKHDAYIRLELIGGSTVDNFNLSISGKGIHYGFPVTLHPYQPYIVESTASSNSISSTQQTNSSSIPVAYPGNSYEVIVYPSLYPNTDYAISAIGSARPYCAAYTVCPMYILRVDEVINVTTGAAGSSTNATLRIG